MKTFTRINILSLMIVFFLVSSCYYSVDVPELEIVEPSEFTQKLLMEDFTGTWCVYCPAAGHAIKLAVEQDSRFIPVGVHYRSITNPEVMQNSFSELLVNEFSVAGFPKVYLNRREALWPNDYLISTLESKLNRYAPVGLAINSILTGNNLDVTVKVGFVTETAIVDNYKLVVFLLEDGLIYPQHNAVLEINDEIPEIIEDYEHNDVLRYSFTNVKGDNLPNQVATDHRYIREYSITLPNTIQNTNNLELVAFVVDKNDNCLNVQYAKVGINQDFD